MARRFGPAFAPDTDAADWAVRIEEEQNMSAATKSLVVAVMALLGLIPTQVAVAADATLYELSEEMSVSPDGYRRATASFQGTAELGTPLCPQILATLLGGNVTSCTVTGIGSDEIDIATDPTTGWPLRSTFGTGKLKGTFAVVVNADNLVDAPEYVVMTGSFEGEMGLTVPAQFTGKRQTSGPSTQLIKLRNGVFKPANVLGLSPAQLGYYLGAPPEMLGIAQATFSGTFRLPFTLVNGQKQKAVKHRSAFYLDDTDRAVPVRSDETALGYPTVRIEVNFNQ
jgi:hypothetical protein